MFSALFSFLGGSVFRMIWGEVSSFIEKRQEHAQEIERMRLQGKPMAWVSPVLAFPPEGVWVDVPVPAYTGAVRLEDLADQPFILQARVSVLHETARQACQAAGFVPLVAQEAEQLSAVLALVRSGLGVALVPSRAASSVPQGVRLAPLAQRVPIETGVALPRDNPGAPARNFAAIACAINSGSLS